MERIPESARAVERLALASACLNRLATLLHDRHQLIVCLHNGDNGTPVLQVRGHIAAEVIAGSVHYWWGHGQGPIGSIGQPDVVAQQIVAYCAGMPAQVAAGARPDSTAARPGRSGTASMPGARPERFPTNT